MPTWSIDYDDEFYTEVQAYPESVQDKIDALGLVLAEFGPQLGRPRADTLKGSRHPNMKELRFKVGKQAWRVAFAFDPLRMGILLAGGNKRGVNENDFYEELIKVADDRFDRHLVRVKQKR